MMIDRSKYNSTYDITLDILGKLDELKENISNVNVDYTPLIEALTDKIGELKQENITNNYFNTIINQFKDEEKINLLIKLLKEVDKKIEPKVIEKIVYKTIYKDCDCKEDNRVITQYYNSNKSTCNQYSIYDGNGTFTSRNILDEITKSY